jgi:hypothetical protein
VLALPFAHAARLHPVVGAVEQCHVIIVCSWALSAAFLSFPMLPVISVSLGNQASFSFRLPLMVSGHI